MKEYRKTLLYTLLVSLFFLLGTIVVLQLYPYGRNSLIYGDADQYYSFLSYYQNTLLTTDNLKYSWSSVLGGNFLSTYCFYCSSPLNVIVYLFKNDLLLSVHLLAYFRIIISSLSFCVLAHYVRKTDVFTEALFSVGYSWIGFVASFIWNPSWMDSIFLLPIITLGLLLLIRKKIKSVYTISLAYAIISNFYLGYMLCIYSVFAYLLILLAERRKIRDSFVPFVISSLTAGLLAAFLLLPVFLSLPEQRKNSLIELIRNMHSNFVFARQFRMYLTGAYSMKDMYNNLPIVFIGIVPLVLCISCFFDTSVPLIKKTAFIIGIGIMLLSFSNSVINIVWHGMSVPNWFNYRYSFIHSFILLIIAYMTDLSVQKKRALGFTGIILCIFFVTVYIASNNKIRMQWFSLDICISAVTILILWIKPKRMILILLVMHLGNIFCNNYLSMNNSVKNFSSDEIHEYTYVMREAVRGIDDGFYRIETDNQLSRCNPMMIGYKGISNYASTEDLDVLEVLYDLGAEHTWMWAKYNNSVPYSSASLLGIRYVIHDVQYDDPFFSHITEEKEYCIFENENVLPVIFSVKEVFEPSSGANHFETINSYWSSLVSEINGKIMVPIPVEEEKYENKMIVSFEPANDCPVYIETSEDISEMKVYQDDTLLNIPYDKYQGIQKIGCFRNHSMRIELTSEKDIENVPVYYEDIDMLSQYAEEVNKNNTVTQIKEVSSSEIVCKTNSKITMKMISTIPFSENWHVMIDGEPVESVKVLNHFLGIIVPEGDHEITLEYVPKGLKTGVVLSVLGFIILIILLRNDAEKIKSMF